MDTYCGQTHKHTHIRSILYIRLMTKIMTIKATNTITDNQYTEF